MDSVTQAALGAALAGAVAGKTLGRTSLLIGAALGTLPDLDVVIDYGTAIANFSQHRGFSHSLLVLLLLSFLLAGAFRRWRPETSYRQWLLLTSLVLITHPLLDSFTTYGTQLFWPFGDPVAITSMFIIDPLYTLPLMVGVVVFLIRVPDTRAITLGLTLSTLYLGWSLAAQQIISNRVDPALADAGMADAPRLVQPMPFSTLLWRVTAQNEQQRVEIITGFLDGDEPVSVQHFPRNSELSTVARMNSEVSRLEWFTRGFVTYGLQDQVLTATDIRLGLPGAHPFVFALGQYDGQTLVAEPSLTLAQPAVQGELLGALWRRITGQTDALCLSEPELVMVPRSAEVCS